MDNSIILNSPLFAGMEPEETTALTNRLTEIDLNRNDRLFSEGEPGDRLYIIGSGKIKLGRRAADGRENLLAILGPGEMLGELTLFDPGSRTATATAIADTTVYELNHSDLVEWINAHPPVAIRLLTALAGRLRHTNDVMGDLVFSDVPGRVAKALLDLAQRFGEPSAEGGLRVAHDLTQEELAQLVGASRETVNKALADFAARGWVQRDGRAIILKDIARLERRAR
ncbi:MAG: Crp/Fnr family transcriptional regulator [Cellulomonadaceae bacterium]|jgi:CRP-like cAMP-binding protein|nr:Crp/Fnr family transcriptional regulator [Cellulomonadaceae bacterium]